MFCEKTFCAKWVWETLYKKNFFVCLFTNKMCLLTLEFHRVFMYHEIFFSFLPQLNTVKTIWWDGYSPRGIICQLWVPSLGCGFTVHITRFSENALLLQQWGGCEFSGLASVLILLDLLETATHLSSPSWNIFFTCPLGYWTYLFSSYLFLIPARFYYLISLPLTASTVLEWPYAQRFSTLVLIFPTNSLILWSQPVSRL